MLEKTDSHKESWISNIFYGIDQLFCCHAGIISTGGNEQSRGNDFCHYVSGIR